MAELVVDPVASLWRGLLAMLHAIDEETLGLVVGGRINMAGHGMHPVGMMVPLRRIMLHRRGRAAIVDVLLGDGLPRYVGAIRCARQYQGFLDANESSFAVGLAFVKADRAGVGL